MTVPGDAQAAAWRAFVTEGQGVLRAASVEVPELAGATLLAIGWATVELERASADLDGAMGPADWQPAPRDVLLGAKALVGGGRAGGAALVVLLEPDTEGRLAAWLARHGEGIAAIYVEAGPRVPANRARGPEASRCPLGAPCRLVREDRTKPFVIAVDGRRPA